MTTLTERFEDTQIFVPELPPSPYPGLRPFQKAEWPIFFGREVMANEVISLLMKQKLLVVHGASGNGKSSLIRAGVLARLEQEHARSGVRWRTCAMNPGDNPLTNLSKAFEGVAQPSGPDWIEFRRALNHGTQSAKAISRLLALGHGDRLCVLVDQFEEIFQNFGDTRRDQSTLLAEFLVGFNESAPDGLFILVTMRSEFLGLCTQFAGLTETINRTQYLLPRMDTDGLLRAVREPALLYDGKITEQLAERLIADARSSQDELPLIQHGLSRLWESAATSAGSGPVLDVPDYIAQGSLSNLISVHADRVADAVSADATGNKIVEELFRALTAINSEGHAIRRQQSFTSLVAITGTTEDRLRQILEAFRKFGVSFITPHSPAPIDAETLIDISHEALIRHWRSIADPATGWLQREFRDGLIWLSLRVLAESFLVNPANLLSEATTEARSGWLKGRNEAWAHRYGGMWPEVERLLDASRREIKRRQEQDRKQTEDADKLRLQLERAARIRVYVRLAIAAFIAMIGFIGFASYQWRNAVIAQQEAETQRLKAEDQTKIADAERSKAETARLDAEAARQTAVAEKLKAEGETRKAETEKSSAELARGVAVEAQRQAETERQKADAALKQAMDALNQRDAAQTKAVDAQNRAAKFQDESALSYVISNGRSKETLARALTALEKEREPLKIAFFGQIVGLLSPLATSAEIQSAMQTLIQSVGRTQDPSLANAITQALSGLAASLSPEQAGVEAGMLLKSVAEPVKREEIKAFALAFGALAPNVSQEDSSGIKTFLVRALMNTDDPGVASVIATALSSLKWAPTSDESETLVPQVLKLLALTKDSEQLGAIATAVTAMAPKLGRQAARNARDVIGSTDPRFADLLEPASNALAARIDQNSNPTQSSSSLLERIAVRRWCTPTRIYSLQLIGNSIVWRDNLGNVDMESIVYNNVNEAETTTQKSVHPNGESEKIGTTWTYRASARMDRVDVSNSVGKKPFMLKPC